MIYNNEYIAAQFSLLAKLMDIHGENSFRSRSYSNAAFVIDKLPVELSDMPMDKIIAIKGISDSVAKRVDEIQQTGILKSLNDLLEKTPVGIAEMLQIKGLGPKKIATIWKEMEIESLGELLYACHENRLMLYKGFGEKTQQSVKESIEFYFKNQGSFLYAEAEVFATKMQMMLQENFPENLFEITGAYRRQCNTLEQLEWVSDAKPDDLSGYMQSIGFMKEEDQLYFRKQSVIDIVFHTTSSANIYTTLFKTTASAEFLTSWNEKYSVIDNATNETAIFEQHQLPYILPCRREDEDIQQLIKDNKSLIATNDIKGIIHCHSKWSDGSNTLEEMAVAAQNQGFEYLIISDHSQSAFYANGLKEDRIKAQHEAIDTLNKKLAPFVIFKSIECDILNDGSLDYPDDILSTFDCVITSVHSNLKMTEEKAMNRLLRAIENPYTNILGHMTGRLLLSRAGYPVNHQAIIEACAANNVVIEINAHPRRLDIDWQWIDMCMEKNVLLSINPDAHHIDGFRDIRYGVLSAQKGGLSTANNLSSFNLVQIQNFIAIQQQKRKK